MPTSSSAGSFAGVTMLSPRRGAGFLAASLFLFPLNSFLQNGLFFAFSDELSCCSRLPSSVGLAGSCAVACSAPFSSSFFRENGRLNGVSDFMEIGEATAGSSADSEATKISGTVA